MDLHIQYITDTKGARTAVQIPFKEWKALVADYRHLRQHSAMKANLKEAFKEVAAIRSGKRKPVTLGEFLDEL